MQRYSIPPDIREKEKIIGGVLTISQTVFVVLGVVIALIVAQGVYSLSNNPIVAIVVAGVCGLPIVAIAFIKKHDYGDMELFQYLIYRFFYKKSKKEFPNINENFRR